MHGLTKQHLAWSTVLGSAELSLLAYHLNVLLSSRKLLLQVQRLGFLVGHGKVVVAFELASCLQQSLTSDTIFVHVELAR